MYFGRMKGMAALALLLTLPVAACEDSGTEMQFGTVSILLTDAPGDEVVEAWVEISDMYLQQAPGDADPVDSRLYLMQSASQTHELLSLANDVVGLIQGATVPAETYRQLRVIIPEGCIRTGDGSIYASDGYTQCGTADGVLEMPSYAETGLKILLNRVDVSDGQENLLLDFDVSQSFGRKAGNSGVWVMDPVIHGAEISAAAGVHATLSAGSVTLPDGFHLGQFGATLVPTTGDNSELPFTDEGSGTFAVDFEYLLPDNGPFYVQLNGPDGLEFTVSPESLVLVNPSAGETAVVDWVIQSASDGGDVICPPWVCF